MGVTKRPSTRAVLYLRISDDPTGLAAGVDRQRADCLRLAEREGLEVVAEYVDNDRSAILGQDPSSFERMLRTPSTAVSTRYRLGVRPAISPGLRLSTDSDELANTCASSQSWAAAIST